MEPRYDDRAFLAHACVKAKRGDREVACARVAGPVLRAKDLRAVRDRPDRSVGPIALARMDAPQRARINPTVHLSVKCPFPRDKDIAEEPV